MLEFLILPVCCICEKPIAEGIHGHEFTFDFKQKRYVHWHKECKEVEPDQWETIINGTLIDEKESIHDAGHN